MVFRNYDTLKDISAFIWSQYLDYKRFERGMKTRGSLFFVTFCLYKSMKIILIDAFSILYDLIIDKQIMLIQFKMLLWQSVIFYLYFDARFIYFGHELIAFIWPKTNYLLRTCISIKNINFFLFKPLKTQVWHHLTWYNNIP